ncbi:hypothetical protein A0H81_13308 [Grifola frondosa]|uniref:Orc1-like AAA ATPase domain-containing protein n=1 Tax=Grifola frondosa TaxID=5627 RepID=A0A1C7LPJ7_GRIFR|nr:hypothetical protein A0H81_13308 [Grifola frondosa]
MANNNVLGFLLLACIPFQQDSTVDSPDARAANLSREFDRVYQGTAVSDFKHGLMDYEQMYDSDRHFGRTIHIVQSSGTGKSRLVKELSHEFPTLSVCFRPTSDIMSSWPPNDIPAREFFLRTGITTMGEELAAAFLGAWLEVALSDITDPANLDKPVHERLHAWHITAERNSSDSHYDRFIKVVQIAEDRLEREREALASIRRKIMSSAPDSATADKESTTAHLTAEDSPIEEEISILTCMSISSDSLFSPRSISWLKSLWRTTYGQDIPQYQAIEPPQWGMSLMALQRILKATDEFAFPGVRFWFLLLDTNCYVTNLAPYWSALDIKSYLLQEAKAKLVFPGDGFDPLDINHVFALFSNRVLLEVASGPGSSPLMAEAVCSHMRLLMGIKSGSMVITKAASEPMLAIAAAELLNDPYRPIFYELAMQTLVEKLVEPGLVLGRGLQGELSCRLLLTLAATKL